MHAIFFTNAVAMGADGCHGEGIFCISASCTPNIQNSYNAAIREETVHAVRDIKAVLQYSVKEAHMAKAMACAKKELEIEVACVGEDSEHLGEPGARFWINSLETMSGAEKLKARMNEKRNAKEQKKSAKKAAKNAGKGRR
ncbi:hypothetical protein AC579_10632 [Pseudocercospora musae]|uniref:Uncharacterized protein n=1 Tax=Pseudocercospora musae TaxID=113226 RepID=A0A139GT36_9PEZI|nr:hypothetical protein AC579_10632 [Pseudocercospora musae]